MRKLRILTVILTVIFLTATGGYFLLHSPKPLQPELSSAIKQTSVESGGIERAYAFYVPARLTDKPPLLFVLHGSSQSIEDIRRYTGYEFERLADQFGFIVVYPNGFRHNWNDCRKAAAYPARTEKIDDEGLIRRLIGIFRKEYGVDPAQVFAAGYSNGGHLAYRFALEMPEEIRAVAAIGANLPTPDNCDCIASGKAVSVLIMNGTEDPINPYEGGEVSLFGFRKRGTVLSSLASARYFAALAGYGPTPFRTFTLPHRMKDDETLVTENIWKADGKPEIVLCSVVNGGHVIPQPVFRAPRLLGKTTSDLNGPLAIWNFFARQSLDHPGRRAFHSPNIMRNLDLLK